VVELRRAYMKTEDMERLNKLVIKVLEACMEAANKVVDDAGLPEAIELEARRLAVHQIVLDFIAMLASTMRKADFKTIETLGIGGEGG